MLQAKRKEKYKLKHRRKVGEQDMMKIQMLKLINHNEHLKILFYF